MLVGLYGIRTGMIGLTCIGQFYRLKLKNSLRFKQSDDSRPVSFQNRQVREFRLLTPGSEAGAGCITRVVAFCPMTNGMWSRPVALFFDYATIFPLNTRKLLSA